MVEMFAVMVTVMVMVMVTEIVMVMVMVMVLVVLVMAIAKAMVDGDGSICLQLDEPVIIVEIRGESECAVSECRDSFCSGLIELFEWRFGNTWNHQHTNKHY